MNENLKHGPKRVRELGYQRYANFDGVDVPVSKAVPSDYDGLMGIPVSFLDHYNSDQFEILGTSLDLAEPMSSVAKSGTYTPGGRRFYLSNGDGTYRRLFERIVIRRR